MNLKAGEIITLRHYSGGSLNKSVIVKSANDMVTLKPTNEFIVFNYFDNDPVVIGYECDREIYLGEGTVVGINYRDSVFDLKVNQFQMISDKRKIERYPTSLYVHIRNSMEKSNAYIRNISKSGMSMYSRTLLNEGQEIELEMSLKEKLLSVKVEIVWKQQESNDFEYGIKMVDMDINIKETLEQYLENLKTEQENMTKKISMSSSVL